MCKKNHYQNINMNTNEEIVTEIMGYHNWETNWKKWRITTIQKQRINDGNKFEYIDNVQMESSLKMKVVPTNVGCKTDSDDLKF